MNEREGEGERNPYLCRSWSMTKWMNVMVMARETGSGDGGNNGDDSEPSLTSALPNQRDF